MTDYTDRFAGKIALVTGAASGLGRATALRLAAEGASVMGIDVNTDGLAAMAESAAGEVAVATVDIRSRDACHQAVADTVARFGALDLVANVAGIARSHNVVDVTQDEWDLIFGVNVEGMFWMCQAAIPHLLERNGSIVNVASNAGLMGQAYTVPYCASKGAVIQLTKALAMEYVKTGLRINAVAPGGMVTALTEAFEIAPGADFDLMVPYMGHRGMGTAEEAAGMICWLASDEGSRCHGSILSIDGGLTAS